MHADCVTSTRRAFIAHQQVDAAFVRTLAVHLTGWETGWAFNDLIPYVDGWQLLATEAIEQAHAFVLVATRNSFRSEPCQFEWNVALALRKQIIRIDLDGCPGELVPDSLRGVSAVVATKDCAEDAARALLDRLRQPASMIENT